MNICIESHVLNHHKRSGLMTYAEGLVYGLSYLDQINVYSLLYYSLSKNSLSMPGPKNKNFSKIVLPVPDRDFTGRQQLIDSLFIPIYLKFHKMNVFHRVNGYSMPNIKGILKVLTVHDLRTLTIGDNLWKQDINRYNRTINNLDMCVVVSECTKRDIIENFNLPEKKIRVIYLGADKRFKPSSPESIKVVHNKYSLKEPFLLSIGSVPRKNIDGIIRAYARSNASKQYQLVLGCNKDIPKYKELTESLGLSDRIVFLTDLQDDEVVALYSSCYCFVFPSLYEGFGLPILEAMQCGAPVITSNISSCPEVAGNAAILVNPNNIQEIADGINQICSDSALRKKLVENGFERAKLFNWGKYAQEILNVYKTL